MLQVKEMYEQLKLTNNAVSVCGNNRENPCFHMANCMLHVPVLENHEQYLFSHQKTGLKMLFIKKR